MSIQSVVRTARFNLPRFVLGLLVASLSGCATPEYSYVTTVSGGERLRFVFAAGRPPVAKGEGIKIAEAGIQPDPVAKKVLCRFRFMDEQDGRTLQNVRVEDVTEDEPIFLIEDKNPTLDAQRQWIGTSRGFDLEDSEIKWIYHLTETVRVYRFTVTLTDGHKIILHQATIIPPAIKRVVRSMFGLK